MTFDSRKHTADNRRDFLRESLMLAAIPVGLVGSVAEASVAAVSGSGLPLRIGLLGCGRRGLQLAAAALGYSEQVKLVSLADVFSDRIQQTFRTLNSQRSQQLQIVSGSRFTGLRACEQLAESDVDAVIVAATPESRPKQVQLLTQAGKHVYLESPLAVDFAGLALCARTVEAAIENGLSICCGMHHRMQPFFQSLVQQLHSQAIGTVLYGRVTINHPALTAAETSKPNGDLRWQLRNWQHNLNFGGHPVVQHLTGSLDLFNWIVGDSPTIQSTSQDEQGYNVEFVYPNGARLVSHVRIASANNKAEKYSFQLQGSSGWCDLSSGRIYDSANSIIGTSTGSPLDTQPALNAWLTAMRCADSRTLLQHQNWLAGAATVATQLTLDAAQRFLPAVSI